MLHPVRIISIALLAAALAGCQSTPEKGSRSNPSNPVEAEFAAAVDRAPTPQTLYATARILIARSEHEKARYVLGRIIERQPDFIPAYNELAESLMREDRLDEAVHVLSAGLEQDDDPILHNNLGMALLMSGDTDAAQAEFAEAAEADPTNARFLSNLAAAHALGGDYDAAFESYLLVMSQPDAHHNVGVIAESRGDADRAAMEFDLATPKTP